MSTIVEISPTVYCNMAMSVGTCSFVSGNYYYDIATRTCKPTVQNLCGNVFPTESMCLEYCRTSALWAFIFSENKSEFSLSCATNGWMSIGDI